jgi:arginyl-tRNA synthetase
VIGTDPQLRPSITTRGYITTLPFTLPDGGTVLAATLNDQPWIESAELAGGFLTIQVTRAALESVPARIIAADEDCVRSDALAGTIIPAGADPLSTRLALAAGAAPAGVDVTLVPIDGAKVTSTPAEATTPAEAVEWAGEDAVRFAVALVPPGRPVRLNMRDIALHRMDNPAYAVRYAHARAASVPRWAGGVSRRDPIDLDLAYQLSWLPERVAIAARRRRPDEFARYLSDLADGIIRQIGPASNLELAAAARIGLAAGLGLLGITAPDRL